MVTVLESGLSKMKNDDCRLCAKGSKCPLKDRLEAGDKEAKRIVQGGQICEQYAVLTNHGVNIGQAGKD